MKQADIILIGNNIFKGAAFDIKPGFVAIEKNKIVAVEDHLDHISDYRTEHTKVLDCGDSFIMPGFHDCHVHIIQGGISQNGVQLGDCKSEEEAAERVGQYAEQNPDMPWILGCGWYHIYWDRQEYPTRKSLDKYVADRPVYLENEDGHGAWVNGKALQLCGITKETKDPQSGQIYRDAEGNPTGYLDELAMLLCGTKAYELPVEYEKKLLKDFMDEAIKNGITSVNDMRPFFTLDVGRLETYESLDKDGEQPIRIHFASNLFEIEKAKALKKKYAGGKLHYFGLKEFIDGVAISYTSLLKEGYADKTDWKGSSLIQKDRLEEGIYHAQREGIAVHLHVTGDEAVALSLDAFEKAGKAVGGPPLRHSLEHIDLISPNDIKRLKQLHIVASMQPEHMAPTDAFKDNPYPQRFGEERSEFAWAIHSILSEGSDVAFGTDFPVAKLNPLQGIYRAVTRKSDDGNPAEGWNPKEKISVTDALGAYTLGSAKMVARENEMGTLEVGKLADIAVLERNPVEVCQEELSNIQVMYTICDGKIVYTKNKG